MKIVNELYEKTKEGMKPFKVEVEANVDNISNDEIDDLFNN